MIATICIEREERPILVKVSRGHGGEIVAIADEDLPEVCPSSRYGEVEPLHTGRNVINEGDKIQLTEDEMELAVQEIDHLDLQWERERERLRQIFKPQRA